jgi:hypothetical protein
MYSTPTLATRFSRNTGVLRADAPLSEDQMRDALGASPPVRQAHPVNSATAAGFAISTAVFGVSRPSSQTGPPRGPVRRRTRQ